MKKVYCKDCKNFGSMSYIDWQLREVYKEWCKKIVYFKEYGEEYKEKYVDKATGLEMIRDKKSMPKDHRQLNRKNTCPYYVEKIKKSNHWLWR